MGALQMTPTTGVIVTGGASGIGRASARALAEVGRPVALWDKNADGAEAAAKEIGADYDVAAVGIGIDVTDTSAFPAAIEQSRTVLGSIGGLVHAAGMPGATVPIDTLTAETWNQVLDVNLRAEALLVVALLADLRANPGSAVVGIASIEAVIGHGAIPAYCASKAGLLGLTRSLADSLAPDGIRVTAVCPGYIDTPMLRPSFEFPGTRERYIDNAPLKRLGQPEDIAHAVRFLMSDEASFVTGTHLIVDGGTTAVD
jgi:NAD(P)-dependent dehydrogenase (short-subunit alcohol dehydrogenase family)